MSNRNCIMGCRLEKGQARHGFPRDAKRRAEWCRILGIYPRIKKVCICGAHFSDCYMFGNRLTRYAVPNPPESRKTNPQIMAYANSMFYRIPNNEINDDDIYRNAMPKQTAYRSKANKQIKVIPQSVNEGEPYEENEISEPEIFNENVVEEPQQDNDNFSFLLEDEEEETSQESEEKVEDFEIRKGSTNDMIIKGRYVQTKDYLVVTYTPPRKWTLQEQVQILDKKCEDQLRQIRYLNKENYRLHRELKKHEMLLPQLRNIKNKYFCLLTELKVYKKNEALRKKRRKQKRVNIETTQQEHNIVET